MLLIVGCSRVGKIKHVTTWGCSDDYQNGGLLLVFLSTDKTLGEAHLTRKNLKFWLWIVSQMNFTIPFYLLVKRRILALVPNCLCCVIIGENTCNGASIL